MKHYRRYWNIMQSKHYYSYNHLLMGQFPELTLVWTIHARSTRSQFQIPSNSDPPQYFLDLYIPSYTPTLSALIKLNRLGLERLGKPSLLIVLQQDPSLLAAK